MSAMTMDTDRRIARLGELKSLLDARPDQATRDKLLDERDELVSELLHELRALHRTEVTSRVAWNEALLARDAMVRDLMDAKVSASAVAHVIDSDRTWPYTIASTYADRLARWRAKQG